MRYTGDQRKGQAESNHGGEWYQSARYYGNVWNRGRQQEVALRTVPVILKNGNRRVFVNCLLDEGSDTTYVNEDVINEIGLTGKKEPITVNVANDQTICFMSGTFEIGLESTDGRVDTKIIPKTSNKICGGLKVVNWVNIQDRWNHLRGKEIQSTYFLEQTITN